MARERKGEQFSIRISKEAKEQIRNNAKLLGISQAKYIEKLAIEGCKVIEIRNDAFIKYMKEQEAVLIKIGTNLDQVAAAINSGKANIVDANKVLFDAAKRAFENYYLKVEESTQKIEIK